VARALERAPGSRYQTALEMRSALDSYCARAGTVMRTDDVGKIVGDLFASDRANVRREVRGLLAASLGTGDIASSQLAAAFDTSSVSRLTNAAFSRSARSAPTPREVPRDVPVATLPKRRRGLIFAAISIGVLVTANVLFVSFGAKHGPAPQAPMTASLAAAPPPVVATPSVPIEPPTPQAATATATVTAAPTPQAAAASAAAPAPPKPQRATAPATTPPRATTRSTGASPQATQTPPPPAPMTTDPAASTEVRRPGRHLRTDM
jgi:hypothetical protein